MKIRMRALLTAHSSLATAFKWIRELLTSHYPLPTASLRFPFLVGLLAIIYVASLSLPPSALGQSESASVSGRVTDQTNAIVPDVEVELRNADTGVSQITKTNGEGFYAFSYIKPGNYVMSVRKQSFQTVSVTGITLNVQDTLSRNFVLQVGSSAESVTVTAESVSINTSDASVSTVVDRNFVESIPLNGRSLQPLITLTPGVVLTTATAPEQGQFSVDGQRADANYVMVDGVGANFASSQLANTQVGQAFSGSLPALNASGGTNSLVSIDAIQEFRIQTSSYAPEFGRTPGGQISIVTRSGTNQFHGDVFDYFRNDALDANDWFADTDGLRKAPLHQNDFGGVIGGPIVPDKAFFFFSYEGLRLLQPTTGQVLVPDAAFRQSAPASLQPLLNGLPVPNGKDLGNGNAFFNAAYSNPTNSDATSIRIDDKLNSRISLFGRYNYAPSQATQRTNSLTTLTHSNFQIQTVTIGSTQALTFTTSNDFRVNYSRSITGASNTVDAFGGAVPPAASIVFPPSLSSADAAFAFIIAGSGTLGFGPDQHNLQRQLNIVDSVAFSRGSHQIKVGVDYRRLTPNYSPFAYSQSLIFFGLTGPSGVASGKIPFAIIGSSDGASLVAENVSLYGQDTWKLNSRLTLTYGLRWEMNPAVHGASGTPLYTVENINDPANIALAPPGTALYKTTYANFAPRLGLAAQLSTRKGFERIVRSGFGIFYDLGSGSLANGAVDFPYQRTKVLFGSFPIPLPASNAAALPFSNTIPPGGVTSIYAAEPNLALPRTYEWNVALEQSLGAKQSVTVTYQGAIGRDLLRQQTFVSPNANFRDVFVSTNSATSDYHSMQIQYQRQLSNGLQALAFYGFSHCIDDASNDSSSFGTDAKIDRGDCDFDIRHSFHAALTYNIPSSRLKSFGKAILGGWAVDTIVVAQSAPPLDLNTGASLQTVTENISVRPDVVPGIPLYLYGPQYPGGKAINSTPGAVANGCPDGSQSIGPFCPPASGQQGNLGRNVLRGFGVTQVDFALRRQFNLTDRWNLQLSAEAFNILNHPNFGTVDGNLQDSPGTFGQATQMLNNGLAQDRVGFSPLYNLGGPRSVQLSLKLKW